MSDLIAATAERTAMPKHEAQAAVRALLDEIAARLAAGETVRLDGIGTLAPTMRAATQGRNPRTGEPLAIAARRALKFTPAGAIKAALNPAGNGAAVHDTA